MENLSPEMQQLLFTAVKWLIGAMGAVVVFLGGVIMLGGKFFASRALKRVDKIEVSLVESSDSIITIGKEMVSGLNSIREALNNHSSEFNKRLGKTEERVAVLEVTYKRTNIEVDDIFGRLRPLETKHAVLAATVEKIVHPRDAQ